jgi:hypothetical protein
MSRDRRRRRDLPPPNRIPRNLDELGFPILPVEEYSVNAWCPGRDGKGPMTQVHLMIKVGPGYFAMRLKSPEELDRLIAALEEYRFMVWPTKEVV